MKWLRFCFALFLLAASNAHAWSANGHQTIGSIADSLIAGSRAEREVQAILGSAGGQPLKLQDVSVWADCARGIQPAQNFKYDSGPFKEAACAIFEDDAGKAEMADFVRRNNTNCLYAGKKLDCHKSFHFADVDIEHNDYNPSYPGTNDHDVVHAILAAVAVLQDRPAPPPFQLGDKKEALKLLVHYVGDVHQPLHVGAVYLADDGSEVHPSTNPPDPASDTIGGNALQASGGNLHHQWDTTKFALTDSAAMAQLVAQAKRIGITPGKPEDWPAVWASDTVVEAQQAYTGITFDAKTAKGWPITFEDRRAYMQQEATLQKTQVIKGGARLATLLQAIWPD